MAEQRRGASGFGVFKSHEAVSAEAMATWLLGCMTVGTNTATWSAVETTVVIQSQQECSGNQIESLGCVPIVAFALHLPTDLGG